MGDGKTVTAITRPQYDDADAYGRLRIQPRGHRIRCGLAKIDLALGGMRRSTSS
jgi:hypothetical protein